MGMKSFKVEKLIRDRLPSIMRSKGISVHERVMEDDEFIQRLKDKLLEEAEEVGNAQNREELLEELADLLEVIHALGATANLPMHQIEEKRLGKRSMKGGFEDRIFNHRVDIEEDNPAIDYYLKKPKQYPLVDDRNLTHKN